MEGVLYFYLVLLIFADCSNNFRDTDCPTNEPIGQQSNIEILDIWEYAWTVFVGIKVYYNDFEAVEPDGIRQTFYCSGSLLKPFLVLTSAGCLQNVKPNYEVIDVFVYGDYNRSVIADFMKVPKKYSLFELKNPEDTEFFCELSRSLRSMEHKKHYIYYYDYAEEYKESDPDIALIGLKKSIIFNLTNKISVPVASSCYTIDYDNCLITELQESNRFDFRYKCKVTFENRTINDGFVEQSFKREVGKLKCKPKKYDAYQIDFYGGNPIMCEVKKSYPKKYAQIGMLKFDKSNKKYI